MPAPTTGADAGSPRLASRLARSTVGATPLARALGAALVGVGLSTTWHVGGTGAPPIPAVTHPLARSHGGERATMVADSRLDGTAMSSRIGRDALGSSATPRRADRHRSEAADPDPTLSPSKPVSARNPDAALARAYAEDAAITRRLNDNVLKDMASRDQATQL